MEPPGVELAAALSITDVGREPWQPLGYRSMPARRALHGARYRRYAVRPMVSRQIFPALTKKNNAVLIPFLLQNVAGNEKLNLADGIHPNVEGHKIVADNVYRALDPLI